jgi:hypothetical protein
MDALAGLASALFKAAPPPLQPISRITAAERDAFLALHLDPNQGLCGLVCEEPGSRRTSLHLASHNFEVRVPLPQLAVTATATDETGATGSPDERIHSLLIKESFLIASSLRAFYLLDLKATSLLDPSAVQVVRVPACRSRVTFVWWLNATWLYLGQANGTLVLWNSNEETLSPESYHIPYPDVQGGAAEGRVEAVTGLALHPVLLDILLIGYESFAILWNSKDSTVLSLFQAAPQRLNCFCWHEDGTALILSFGHDFYIYAGLSSSSKRRTWFKKKAHALLATWTVAPAPGDHKESKTTKLVWTGRYVFILDEYSQGLGRLTLTADFSRIEGQLTYGRGLDVLDMRILGEHVYL